MKLVRDKIPQIIEEDGKTCEYHIAGSDEYRTRLYEKMREELDEFVDTPCYEEAADMYEVLRGICLSHALSMEVVENVAMEKRSKRGAFHDRIVLEVVGGGSKPTRAV
jgi:predicted house-cleaning noncanonical NTP pyrophosphatase (MazG superfamily)